MGRMRLVITNLALLWRQRKRRRGHLQKKRAGRRWGHITPWEETSASSGPVGLKEDARATLRMKGRPVPHLRAHLARARAAEKNKTPPDHGYKHTIKRGYLAACCVGKRVRDLSIHALTCLSERGCNQSQVSRTSGAWRMLPTLLGTSCGCFSLHGRSRHDEEVSLLAAIALFVWNICRFLIKPDASHCQHADQMALRMRITLRPSYCGQYEFIKPSSLMFPKCFIVKATTNRWSLSGLECLTFLTTKSRMS